MIWRDSGKYCSSHTCSFDNCRVFNFAKAVSKLAACSCHAGSFVNGASGELFGTGIPARKRAVSSGEDTTWPDASICCGGGSCRRLASAESATNSTKIANVAEVIFPVEKFFIGEG